jgi:hypothetical protein
VSGVPFERVIWDADECAAYLRQEKASFLKRTQFATGFPPRLDLPGHPRWQALQVTEFALSRNKSRHNPAIETAHA